MTTAILFYPDLDSAVGATPETLHEVVPQFVIIDSSPGYALRRVGFHAYLFSDGEFRPLNPFTVNAHSVTIYEESYRPSFCPHCGHISHQ